MREAVEPGAYGQGQIRQRHHMKILHISDLHYHESSDAWALLKEAASALGEGRSKEKSQRVRNKVNQCR